MHKGNSVLRSLVGTFFVVLILILLFSDTTLAVDCENGKYFNAKRGIYEVCRPQPDLSECKDLGSRGYINKIRSISGKETELRTYQCGNKLMTIYIFMDKTVYGYAVYQENPKEIQWYWDYDMDGNFESGIKITY